MLKIAINKQMITIAYTDSMTQKRTHSMFYWPLRTPGCLKEGLLHRISAFLPP